jgi:hypothetical protein
LFKRLVVVCGTCVTVLLAATPALASGSWSTPATLSPTGHGVQLGQAALSESGTASVVWGSSNVVSAAIRSGSDAWGPTTQLSTPGASALGGHVAVTPDGSAVAVWYERTGQGPSTVRASSAHEGAGWSSPVTLSAALSSVFGLGVGVDRAGGATVAWTQQATYGASRQVAVVTCPAGSGACRSPLLLSAGGVSATDVEVAVDPAGAAVVGWAVADGSGNSVSVVACVRPANGGFGPVVTLDSVPSGSFSGSPSVGIDGSGSPAAVWTRGPSGGPYVVESSSGSPSGDWSAPVGLSDPTQLSISPAVAVDGSGRATALWQQYNSSSSSSVLTSARSAGGSWGAPSLLAQSGSGATVSASPDGSVVVAGWSTGANTAQTATASGGGAFGTAYSFTSVVPAYGPSIAVAAADFGKAVAAFPARQPGRYLAAIQASSRG